MKKKDFNRIKEVLTEKKLTTYDLADGVGRRRETVSRWCTNASQPTVETLFLIADYLKVDVRELLVPNIKSKK